jgi:uncharacterized protein (DUF433 family)
MLTTPAAIDVPLRTDEHGKIRVGGTRVLLELVIYLFQQGETAEGIIDSYPTLKLADVYAVIAYYLTHQAEVDAYVRQAEQEADRIQREVESQYSPETLARRARLRALRDERRRAGL